MAEIISNNIYLIILMPLWIFLVIMTGRFFAVYVNNMLINILTLFSSLLGMLSCGGLFYTFSPDNVFEYQLPFIKINDFIIHYGIYIDKTALIFAFILFSVSFFVQLFSIFYMKEEKKRYRFFALLNLFNFALAGLFFSPNLFQTYVFWEIASVVSYLLIGFDYFNTAKSKASKKVFIINRIGDTALISGIILSSYFMFEYAPDKSLAALPFMDMNIISTLLYSYTSKVLFLTICGLFIISAIVKSAQAPFYMWLQEAMEAKLPVSALLHSATLVTLGIYLVIRTLPFLTFSPTILKLIALTGILTAIICSLSACAQINPKKALAYSTSAQIGIMFFALGILNIKTAVMLFCAHAFIKSMLFLTLPDENREWDYFSFISFIIGGFSLSGMIFSGLCAKEVFACNLNNNGVIILSLLSFATAFYTARLAFNIASSHGLTKTLPDKLKITAISGLIFLNIILYVILRLKFSYKITEPFWSALFGWIFVYILYTKNKFIKIPILYEICYEGFYFDKILTSFSDKLFNYISTISEKIEHKIFENYTVLNASARIAVNFSGLIENKIMNKSVELIKNGLLKISENDLKMQQGNIQRYNLYAFLIITVIITCLILAYTAIISYAGG